MEGERENIPPDASVQSSDQFYEKLIALYESTGFCLLFNFRKTILDLYMFYQEVTARGGFEQVTEDGKWGDIASAMNLNTSISVLPLQLQTLYANFLYKFELIYFYRQPAKSYAASGDTFSVGERSSGKRKWGSSLFSADNFSAEDDSTEKSNCNNTYCQLTECKVEEEKQPPTTEELKRDPKAPVRFRTAFLIFLSEECARLKKKLHGEKPSGPTVRKMAIDAWKCLSENDREPYIEKSRKDKERYHQEMAVYEYQCQIMHNTADDYHVTLQPDADNPIGQDELKVEFGTKLMENAQPDDYSFEINWDGQLLSRVESS